MISARQRLVKAINSMWEERKADIEGMKQRASKNLRRRDFVWHHLLQSFATMGRVSGWHGLIGNETNYQRVRYDVLAALTPAKREKQVRDACRAAKIRMPDRKAKFILACFDAVKNLGGPLSAKRKLMALHGREAKLKFLDRFPGIGPKYARNIMMDAYHPDFWDSIAIDARIKSISALLGLPYKNGQYAEHEAFFLKAAHSAGINGWELDRLMFNFASEFRTRLAAKPSERATRRHVR